MKRILRAGAAAAGVAAVVLISIPAMAADMTPPPPLPMAAYSWTGLYIGANAGYSIGSERGSIEETFVVGNRFLPFVQPRTEGRSQSGTLAPAGAIGGGQIGYNVQARSNVVLGIEADWQWAGQNDSICVGADTCGIVAGQKLDQFATLRGRLGYAQDRWLWYVTAGGAMARVTGTLTQGLGSFGTISANFSDRRTGWVAGGGVEAAIAGGWTAKVEYLYLDLGTVSLTGSVNNPGITTNILDSRTTSMHSPIRDHVVRLGLNYRFAGEDPVPYTDGIYKAPVYKAPVVAAIYNWTGFYIGENAGGSVGRMRYHQVSPDAGIIGEQLTLSPAGWVAGLQVGYNWAITPNFVVGVEADWQWTGQKDSTCTWECTFTATQLLGSLATIIQPRLNWLSTGRVRFGYAQANWLVYATAGAAWGHIEEDIVFIGNQAETVSKFAHTKVGFAAGGGIETALAGNWSAKAEYLYVDLGNWTEQSGPISFGNFFGPPRLIETNFKDHIFRVGLNYRFGGGPVVANY
jgi:outer membrane immunogenic protein